MVHRFDANRFSLFSYCLTDGVFGLGLEGSGAPQDLSRLCSPDVAHLEFTSRQGARLVEGDNTRLGKLFDVYASFD